MSMKDEASKQLKQFAHSYQQTIAGIKDGGDSTATTDG